MGTAGGVFAECEYIGGTRGSGIVSSADEVLEMSVVRGVGGMCDMCMARGGWEDWVWALPIMGEDGTCVCVWVAAVWVVSGDRLCPGSVRVGVDGRSRYLYIVLGGYQHILGAPRVQSC